MLFEYNGKLYGGYVDGPLCEYDETGSPVRIVWDGEEAEEVAEAMEDYLHAFDAFEDIGGGNGPLIAE